MANRKFSSEELAEMRHNPFVKNATENKLSFTTEFKEYFWKRARAGEPLGEIVRAFGLNPEVLGERRIKGIYAHLNEQVAARLPFTDEKRVRIYCHLLEQADDTARDAIGNVLFGSKKTQPPKLGKQNAR